MTSNIFLINSSTNEQPPRRTCHEVTPWHHCGAVIRWNSRAISIRVLNSNTRVTTDVIFEEHFDWTDTIVKFEFRMFSVGHRLGLRFNIQNAYSTFGNNCRAIILPVYFFYMSFGGYLRNIVWLFIPHKWLTNNYKKYTVP